MCDVLGQPLLVPQEQDAVCSAALITGVAARLFEPMPAAIQGLIKLKTRLEPELQTHSVYNELFEIYCEADQSLTDIAHRLTAFEQRLD